LHTLNGSAAMAGAHSIAELVDPFEQYCKLLQEHGEKLSPEDVQLLAEIQAMVPRQLDTLKVGGAAPEGLDALTTRVRRRLIDGANRPAPTEAPAPANLEEKHAAV